MELTKIWITRPKKRGRKQFCYQMRWQEPVLDENGQPVFDENGKLRLRTRQESTGTKDRTTAESIAKDRFLELNALKEEEGKEEEAEPSITLVELSQKDEQWLRNHRRSAGTIYLSKLALRYFSEVVGAKTPIGDIGADQIENFIAARNAKKRSPVSVNRELSCLRATFNRAVRYFRILDLNPLRDLRKLPVTERQIRPLTRDEEKALLEACADDLELDVYVRLALDTGCRAGELSNLLWDNLDLAEGTGLIECNTQWKSKNRRERFIAFTPETAQRLERWRRQRTAATRVFGEEDGPDRAHYRRIRARFSKAVARAGIRRITLHDLRRTLGSRLAMAGVNQKVASVVLGHSNIATTARFYQAVEKATIKEAVLRVRGITGNGPAT